MAGARGRFITLEGIDGAGQRDACAVARGNHRRQGPSRHGDARARRNSIGETLRNLLLTVPMTHECEALLMFAARREHVGQVIRPALERGEWVVCDRFTDATYAYQGGGHGVPARHIAALEGIVHADLQPDLTLLFDVPLEVSRARLAKAEAAGRALDKFEAEKEAFFARVREAYLARAAAAPQRFRIVDSSRPIADVRADLARLIDAW
jgi:dTMP kinase